MKSELQCATPVPVLLVKDRKHLLNVLFRWSNGMFCDSLCCSTGSEMHLKKTVLHSRKLYRLVLETVISGFA